MPKGGVCGWSFSGWAMTKHAETPCGEEDSKAEPKPFTFCDGCGAGLEYKQWKYIPSGGTYLCDNCNDERIGQ